MTKKVVALTIILVLILSVSVLASISFSERFPFRRNLKINTIAQTDNGLPEFDYIANFTDSDKTVGTFYFRVEPEFFSQQHNLYLDVQNLADTQLDSITLRLESSQIAFVYFAGHTETTYSYSRSGGPHTFTVTIGVNDKLGSIQGSSTFEFILVTTNTNDGDLSLSMQAEISMHYMQPLPLTELKAESSHDINLHQNS